MQVKIGKGSAGQDWEGECGAKEGSFHNSVDGSNESLAWYLPNPYLPQGMWSRAPFAYEKEEYLSSSSLVVAPRIGFEYTVFSCSSNPPPPSPLALPSLLKFPLPVSLSRSDAPEGHVSSVEVQ